MHKYNNYDILYVCTYVHMHILQLQLSYLLLSLALCTYVGPKGCVGSTGLIGATGDEGDQGEPGTTEQGDPGQSGMYVGT